ncbi:MAG TPA: TfuA-like protein [Bdellovibrionota bacterium]|nr:TfuA-like protein [Bdellovibrionota bacterium]
MRPGVRIKVYTGLSLSESQVREILPDAIVSEPIGRWDVEKDIAERTNVLAIIDGKFGQVPPVVPGEIMDALRVGILVYGSSSMGALRAADLHPFGMIGVGKIFHLIKDSEAFRDDYLGQLIVSGFSRDLSLPYIDFYFNLRELEKRGKVARRVVQKVERIFGDIHFSQRSPASLGMLIEKAFSKDPKVYRLLKSAASTMGSQKMRDGIEMLKKVKSDLERIGEVNSRLSANLGKVREGSFAPYWKNWT